VRLVVIKSKRRKYKMAAKRDFWNIKVKFMQKQKLRL